MNKHIFLHSTIFPIIVLLTIFFLLTPCHTFHLSHQSKGTHKESQDHMHTKDGEKEMERYPTGSRLPDCSYACGACAPCRRVMVSFMTCSVESCPVVYRCVCRGRFFHVPSV